MTVRTVTSGSSNAENKIDRDRFGTCNERVSGKGTQSD